MKTKSGKISMEQYLDFFASHTRNAPANFVATANFLNQIICMHGFKKIYKSSKKVLLDSVATMDLVSPWRSTLNENGVSSRAFISAEEIQADLKDLDWQECFVTSIQTLNTEKDPNSLSSGPSSKRKRRRQSTAAVSDADADASLVIGSS